MCNQTKDIQRTDNLHGPDFRRRLVALFHQRVFLFTFPIICTTFPFWRWQSRLLVALKIQDSYVQVETSRRKKKVFLGITLAVSFTEILYHYDERTETHTRDIISKDRFDLIVFWPRAKPVAPCGDFSNNIVQSCIADCFHSSWRQVYYIYVDRFFVNCKIRVPARIVCFFN